jgi:CheY-like chemotaxis protein
MQLLDPLPVLGTPQNGFTSFERLAPIWVIEDDCSVREVLELSFRYLGFRVHWASNAAEALNLLSGAGVLRPRLVIIDGRLPDSEGRQLAASLRESLPPETEIYLFSADPLITDSPVEELLPYGIRGILRKPYDTELLLELAQKHAFLQ